MKNKVQILNIGRLTATVEQIRKLYGFRIFIHVDINEGIITLEGDVIKEKVADDFPQFKVV
jgi:hypothetical protein